MKKIIIRTQEEWDKLDKDYDGIVYFENGQNSVTNYKVIKTFQNLTLIECELETGRTHQIRVHMSGINHPLLGDTLYGKCSDLINRQALHCHSIEFLHPITNEKIKIDCDLPNDFIEAINLTN